MQVRQSSKLSGVSYEIRGPVAEHAARLEAEGHHVVKLNTGNPLEFGLDAPQEILSDIVRMLPTSSGYSTSKGLLHARRAVAQYYETRGVQDVDVENVFLGNGVSELVMMSMTALLETGDEVLIPAPDFPLWTAATTLNGGRAVHYVCDEASDWFPDVDDIASKITDRTRAIVLINPNNPTGAVYPDEVLLQILELARRHQLVVFSDEIYDKILYDGATHTSTAALASDVLCVTFSGLSKVYRSAGLRAGWMVLTGASVDASSYIEGLTMLAGLRLCPNVPGQQAISVAIGGRQSIYELTAPGGRLYEQSTQAWKSLNDIPGISCVKPKGALYVFPRIDLDYYQIHDDEKFVLDLLLQEKLHIVQGTGFNWPRPDHFRIVTLPHADDLEAIIGRIGKFLANYKQ
ncbi:pyridoxal phosphate-dependent aminotransferase [Rhodococcus sp. BP-252]|uniref:alanine transaminase n=1 Tax=Rhodococcoides kyotonense TaxID=398843 RepID=A0A177YFL3_9NOCA|nr:MULTISPECIES: pyridoxal phosphate-dependent aminotransferase [Rhodococcus]MBY6410909.1 pyridoxal phosphate-dependent aminotransferase [Rhodococcus sp. BP-320]MBY6415266.1 pyridoxal phosphate-dependent aminotransferase [Rhodococcus sp. BP-321]MBY6419881.1 pyridoxal phosphate-dependent aminotransferase [Rhodococcus sp. BP-324]MBY6425465.1 pyridoxal phosphate-dependent aminotransferase [Rhodococcus sp. BP-323]MBY6430472.1 pyridoxal phosphate-dependent aminotransferase [Rhodococcus sp. BP-322]